MNSFINIKFLFLVSAQDLKYLYIIFIGAIVLNMFVLYMKFNTIHKACQSQYLIRIACEKSMFFLIYNNIEKIIIFHCNFLVISENGSL